MGCDCQPQITHSQLSLTLTKTLQTYTYIYLAYCILKLFIFPVSFFSDLITILLLYATFKQCSYIMGYLVLFFLSFDLLFESLYFLQIIQNFIFGLQTSAAGLIFIIRCINIFFYFMLLKYTFLCSREYKALFVEQNGGNNNNLYKMFNDNNYRNNDIEQQKYGSVVRNDQPKGYVPFSGQGYTWGNS